ncbi:MAG TPA: PqqD family protein [Syntrophomonadaceae bacterium]|nr:PqqD family protein [Syntrophomonadaceae bacterium]
MKVKDGFMLREVAGQWLVIPIGERVVEFNGIITLSESGALLWKAMEEDVDEEALVKVILGEYVIDEATARADVAGFITMINERDLLDA